MGIKISVRIPYPVDHKHRISQAMDVMILQQAVPNLQDHTKTEHQHLHHLKTGIFVHIIKLHISLVYLLTKLKLFFKLYLAISELVYEYGFLLSILNQIYSSEHQLKWRSISNADEKKGACPLNLILLECVKAKKCN